MRRGRGEGPRGPVGRRPLHPLALFLLLAVLLAGDAWGASRRVAIGEGMVATLDTRAQLFLEAEPLRGEGLYAYTRRLTGDTEAAGAISRLNGRPRRLLARVRYKVPFEVLSDSLKRAVVQNLFPSDRATWQGWEHEVAGPHTPSLWRVSEWFTGDGRNFAAVRSANSLVDDTLSPGQRVVIPRELLLPPFRTELPLLEYERGEDGDFAVYHLRRGEALYSAVVVRFLGAIFAEDVNQIASEIATLNGISDVRDMPVGQEIRIPFDLLLPEYLPSDDPRRQEYELERSESERYSNTVRASRLEGITVILDAGHGGHDPGVSPSGVWESIYVYDIMVRVKDLLESETSAKVVPTTRDGNAFVSPDRDQLPKSRGHTVLTDPPYPITDSKVGANLRWYLANSEHRAAVRTTGDDGKTVFLSIHADSLPSSHRGMMTYIPAASLTRGEYGKSGPEYDRRAEVREQRRVSFSWTERTRSEGLSRELAQRLIEGFRRQGLRIHHEKPIRDRVIRCRRCRPWVPAVVRYNAVPTKLLLEVCNLNNSEDRRLLQTRAFREKVAVAIVDGILAYYGQTPLSDDPPPTVAP